MASDVIIENSLWSEAEEVSSSRLDDWKTPIDDPRWDEAETVHDWRNYVPDAIVELWSDLDLSSRIICYVLSQQQANREEWD